MKNCKQCGKEFEPKNPKGVFCSDKCRVYYNRKRKVKFEESRIFAATQTSKIVRDYTFDAEKLYHEIELPCLNKPKTLEELKLLCPKELTGFDRSQWIATERQKYKL